MIYTQNKSIQTGLALVIRLVKSCNCLTQLSVQYHRWKEPPNGFKLSGKKKWNFIFSKPKLENKAKWFSKMLDLFSWEPVIQLNQFKVMQKAWIKNMVNPKVNVQFVEYKLNLFWFGGFSVIFAWNWWLTEGDNYIANIYYGNR